MTSGEIERFAACCYNYQFSSTPAQLAGIQDEYTAYCFNEAMMYIIMRLKNGDRVVKKGDDGKPKKAKSFRDMYKNYQ